MRYESVGRGFESLPSHQENQNTFVFWFSFCLHSGRDSNRAAAHSAASNQPSGLLLSPRVPTHRNVYCGSCGSKDFMAFLFYKPWLHGFCTVGVFHVRLCRALYCIAISALFCCCPLSGCGSGQQPCPGGLYFARLRTFAHMQKVLPRRTAQNTPGKFYLN